MSVAVQCVKCRQILKLFGAKKGAEIKILCTVIANPDPIEPALPDFLNQHGSRPAVLLCPDPAARLASITAVATESKAQGVVALWWFDGNPEISV